VCTGYCGPWGWPGAVMAALVYSTVRRPGHGVLGFLHGREGG
jgi:hypothetical protein